jgi:hypothetical protein
MKTLSTALAFVLLFSSCATIVQRPVSTRVDSTPSQLSFRVVNATDTTVREGVTPATISLPAKQGYFRGQTYTLNVYQNGRLIGSTDMSPSVSPWYFGNIVLGGLVGMLAVDPATGAMWRMPRTAHVTAGSPVLSSVEPATESLQIVALADVPGQQRKHLVRL